MRGRGSKRADTEPSINKDIGGYVVDFDPEAHPHLKKLQDLSEILIRRNFRKPRISIRTKKCIKKFVGMIRSLQPRRTSILKYWSLSFNS